MKDKVWLIGYILLALNMSLIITIVVLDNREEKLVCKSDSGKIILYYDDTNIIKYTSKTVEFNLEGQNYYAERIGIDKYLEEYSVWFKDNYGGKCK